LEAELDQINKELDEEIAKIEGESEFNPQLFLIGFAKGLEQKDISSDLEKCAPAEMKVAQAVQRVIQDIMQKTEEGVEQAIEDAKKVLQAYRDAMVTCAE
jgi:hypothetical protein